MVADLGLLIAATAIVQKLSLATLNTAHFSQIDRLRIEDWN